MANRTKNINLHFMVSEAERDLIKQKMKLANIQNMRAYLLKMAVDGYVIRMDLSDVHDLVSLLRNATNNLNQIARRVNETNQIYQTDIADLQEHYEQLWDKAEDILCKLTEI